MNRRSTTRLVPKLKFGNAIVFEVLLRFTREVELRGQLRYQVKLGNEPKRDRHLIFYSENLTREQFDQIYWEGYDFCATWDEVVQTLKSRHGETCKAGVFPCASIQIVE